MQPYIFTPSIQKFKTLTLSPQHTTPTKKPEPQYTKDLYHQIEPLPNFNLSATPPLKLRPFRPTYHMTMAIENTSLSDLIAMDNTFAERCQIRKALIQKERYEVLACNPIARPAVLELYTWLTSTYLPTRFPTIYHTTATAKTLLNTVTGEHSPLHLDESDAETALQLLGSNIDTEFFILLPITNTTNTPPQDPQKYRLEAFVNCTPSGFNTRSKLNLLLSDIHTPVPGYAQKLEKSMDRYFASLPTGKIVKRANWSISTNGQLFCLAGNHMSAEELKRKGEMEEEIDLNRTVLRCERQTLHRLHETGALVFAFVSREIENGG